MQKLIPFCIDAAAKNLDFIVNSDQFNRNWDANVLKHFLIHLAEKLSNMWRIVSSWIIRSKLFTFNFIRSVTYFNENFVLVQLPPYNLKRSDIFLKWKCAKSYKILYHFIRSEISSFKTWLLLYSYFFLWCYCLFCNFFKKTFYKVTCQLPANITLEIMSSIFSIVKNSPLMLSKWVCQKK